ncbi:hypothetical protein N9835_02385 [Alphaproteobacteria bacterium]|nr:hypothetical protein [Alphaproteobacteria bacterium]
MKLDYEKILNIFLGVFLAGLALMLVYWIIINEMWVLIILVPTSIYLLTKLTIFILAFPSEIKGIKENLKNNDGSIFKSFKSVFYKYFLVISILGGYLVISFFVYEYFLK